MSPERWSLGEVSRWVARRRSARCRTTRSCRGEKSRRSSLWNHIRSAQRSPGLEPGGLSASAVCLSRVSPVGRTELRPPCGVAANTRVSTLVSQKKKKPLSSGLRARGNREPIPSIVNFLPHSPYPSASGKGAFVRRIGRTSQALAFRLRGCHHRALASVSLVTGLTGSS